MRDRIRHRHNRLEPKLPLGITLHHAPPIRRVQIRVLHIVMPCAVRLPDVDLAVGDGLIVDVREGTEHEEGLAGRVVGDGLPVGEGRGVVCVEGAEDGAFRGVGGFRVVDAVDEEGEAQDVGEENEFLSCVQHQYCVLKVWNWIAQKNEERDDQPAALYCRSAPSS